MVILPAPPLSLAFLQRLSIGPAQETWVSSRPFLSSGPAPLHPELVASDHCCATIGAGGMAVGGRVVGVDHAQESF